MKKIAFLGLSLIVTAMTSFSQPVSGNLPASTAILHYKLTVGYSITTILIFPAPVKEADRGNKDLLAQKQPAVDNVLKIKASRRDFTPTNLHVFTSDGKIYAFDVSYTPDPPQTTYDLTKLDSSGSAGASQQKLIEFSRQTIDIEQLKADANKVRGAKPSFSTSSRKYRMKVQLQTICQVGDLLLFGFEITNRSNLSYDIDFTRLYIRDKRSVKRSSLQQREMPPLYVDTVTTVPGHSSVKWVVAVSKFSIPDQRKFVFETYERNGGRHLVLEVKNRQLFRAKNLKY